jgi:hypothetical protein
LFLNKVLPLETISTIASARPMFGAISTEQKFGEYQQLLQRIEIFNNCGG